MQQPTATSTGRAMRRRLALVLAVLLATLGLAGCTETKVTSQAVRLSARSATVLALLNPGAIRPPGTVPLADALRTALPAATITETAAHDDQAMQVEQAGNKGIGILLVQPVDAQRIGPALKKAHKAGVLVVTVGEIPKDVGGIDLHIGWDEFSIGEQEIARLAATLKNADSTQHLEMFAGPRDSLTAMARFNGAMFALKALNEAGTLTVKSGQTNFGTAAVESGDQAAAAKRLATTYQATYPRHELAAVVIPDDAMAPTIRQVAADAGHKPPLLLSSGASTEGVRDVMAGTMLTTQYRDAAVLAAAIARTVTTITSGAELTVNPQSSRRNRLRKTPAVLVSPQLVSKDNAAKVLAGNPVLAPLTHA
ncbi:substrate-binding domain-containing protein [Propionibacteriaceae bacterium G1746]|uniref:substrate-binding domain-containing protein n=1 Tax=Aestuariimicrobium sp. G57 TaxID=3418485 RepID=UPI003C23EBC7